jgi:hypothetical protein
MFVGQKLMNMAYRPTNITYGHRLIGDMASKNIKDLCSSVSTSLMNIRGAVGQGHMVLMFIGT